MCGPARLNGRHCLTLPSCGFFHSSEDGVQATSETARLWAAERDVDRTSLFPATFVFAEMRALLIFLPLGERAPQLGTPQPHTSRRRFCGQRDPRLPPSSLTQWTPAGPPPIRAPVIQITSLPLHRTCGAREHTQENCRCATRQICRWCDDALWATILPPTPLFFSTATLLVWNRANVTRDIREERPQTRIKSDKSRSESDRHTSEASREQCAPN